MIKKLLTISLSLVLTLIPLTSPAMAGESVETATIHHIDISSMYDVDTIGGVGDTITWKATTATKFAENTGCSNCWWGYNWGDRYKDTIFQGLSALKPGFPSTLSFLNKETGDITLKKVKWGTDGAASLSENPETFTFKTFNSDSFKGGTMDGKKLYNKGTFTASLKPLYTRSIKFLMGSVISGNNAALKGTITYVDGTTTTFKEQWYVSANNGNDIRVDEMTYYDKTYYTTKNSGRSENIRAFALNNEKFAPVVQKGNGDGTFSLISDTTTAGEPYEVENIGFRGYEVDVDPGKIVKEITIATAWGSYDTYSCILYALAQEEANSSDYYAYLDKFDVAANQPDANGVFTAKQATAIRNTVAIINKLQEKNADLSGYTAISDLIDKYNSAELIYDTDASDNSKYYIDLRKLYNHDAIASKGDIVAADKNGTFSITSAELPTNTDNYINFKRITSASTSEVVQTEDVKMFMDSLIYPAGVNDSIKLAEVGNSVTIPLVETNTKNIRFTVDNLDGINYNVTVNYSDNTSDTYTINSALLNDLANKKTVVTAEVATKEDKRNGLIGFNADYNYHPTYTEQDDGTFVVGTVKDTQSARRGVATYQVVPDATKFPVSVTFKAGKQNMIIYTLSQKTLATDDIKAFLDSVLTDDTTLETATIFSKAQIDALETAEAYLEILESKGGDISAYATLSAIIEKAAAQLPASETARVDIDTVETVINFVSSVSDFSGIVVKKNGTAITNYTISSENDGKTAKITFNESRNGGNTYEISVPGELGVISYGSDAYTYLYVVPDYAEVEYNSGHTVKNNSEEDINYFAASVIKSEDGKINYEAVSAEGTVEAGLRSPKDEKTLTEEVTDGKKVLTVLWNDKMKTISNDSQIPVCTETETAASYDEPVFSMKDNTLTVAGKTSSNTSGKVVNFKIVDKNGKLILVDTMKTAANGYFCFKSQFPDEIFDESFEMHMSLGGDDFEKEYKLEKVIYFYPYKQRLEFIENKLMDADKLLGLDETETTAEIIEEMKKVLALDFGPVNAITPEALAAQIASEGGQKMLDPEDVAVTQANLKVIAILAAFDEGSEKAENALFNGTAFMHDDVMNYSGIDSDGVTLWNIYNNAITADGQEAVKDALLGVTYADSEALMDKICEEIFLNALKYPTVGGTGYITNLLTSANAKAIDADISNYTKNKDSQFNSDIAQNASYFTSVDVFETYIKNYEVSSDDDSEKNYIKNKNVTSTIKTSGITLDDTATVTPVESSVFSDVDKNHWAYNNIISLFNQNIISGKGAGIFAPDDSITRGELVKMLCVAYGLESGEVNPFNDTEGKWYSDFAAAAYAKGIVKGITDTEFGGDSAVTRQDLCTILYRMKNEAVTGELSFADKDSVSEYAKDAVVYMNEKGIVNGFSDGTFKPLEICSRAQCAKIIDLFIKLQ